MPPAARHGPTAERVGSAAPWRLLDDLDSRLDAAGQMAADLALLDAVAAGGPSSLRCYRWRSPALTLGRFQPAADVDLAACRRIGVEVARRPTGGRALLHGADLTYAVAFPEPRGAEAGIDSVYRRVSGALIAGLARLGVEAAVARNDGSPGAVCMAGQQGADLRVGSRKVCGSAQVRHRGVVLQHGSVLLDRLPFDETDLVAGGGDRAALRSATVTLAELGAPTDPRVVADALAEGFREALNVDFTVTADPAALDLQSRPIGDGGRVGTSGCVTDARPSLSGSPVVGTLDPMRCRRCGHQNETGANYCSSCGTPLSGDDDETTLSLSAIEDRQTIEEEYGDLLAQVPTSTAILVVRRGPNEGSTFTLDRTVTSLGRHPDSDIFLDDVTVSRRHAEITRGDRGYEVRDVGSLNGTYVDHERVEVAGLRDLNELQIGRFVLTFVFGSGPDGGPESEEGSR